MLLRLTGRSEQTHDSLRTRQQSVISSITTTRAECPLIISGAYGEGQLASTTSLLTCLAISRADFDGFDFLTWTYTFPPRVAFFIQVRVEESRAPDGLAVMLTRLLCQ